MKRIYSLWFVLFLIAFSHGQNPKQNERRTISAGQPKLITKHYTDKGTKTSHNIHCSLMDKSGKLWFGTTGDGVYYFDGKLFVNLTVKDGLSDNCVWSVLEDKEGNIWFGTKAGVCFYNGATITSIPITTTINSITAMLQDKKGIIWFGTDKGVFSFNRKTFTHFLENDSVINKNGPRLLSVERILEDKNGNIWFTSGMGGGEGVCRYDGKAIESFKPNGDVWVPYILENKTGDIWFSGRSHGYFRYGGNFFTDFTENLGYDPILQDQAESLCLKGKLGFGPMLEDKAGNIWFTGKMTRFGGLGGLWRYDGKFCTNFSGKEDLGDKVIWCMTQDKEGNIWLGTNDTGLYCFDGKTFTCFSE